MVFEIFLKIPGLDFSFKVEPFGLVKSGFLAPRRCFRLWPGFQFSHGFPQHLHCLLMDIIRLDFCPNATRGPSQRQRQENGSLVLHIVLKAISPTARSQKEFIYQLGRGLGGFYPEPMRPLRFLLLYLAVIFLGAALLAPWLYWLAHAAAGHSPRFARLSAQPFHRYVNRSLLGLAVLGLWPFLRSIGADSWAAVGLVKPAGQGRRLMKGFAIGFASLAVVALLAVAAGARMWRTDYTAAALSTKVAGACLSALVVALLEELLFRGALFGALRKAHRWTTALVLSSAVYALVHFFQKPVSPTQITWSSGLELLPLMLRGFSDFQMLVPGFFTLLLAGMILGLAYQRTGNLYMSIGLHAGWIFWLKFYGTVTVASLQASQSFWGTEKLIDGWLASVILVLVLLAVWCFPSKQSSISHAPAAAH